MISTLGQVMVYVDDQDAAVSFWTETMGFTVVEETSFDTMRWIEVSPPGGGTSIVLHNKKILAEMEPELNLGTPSLMFFTDDVDGMHRTLSEKGVTVGDVVEVPEGRVFNFSDAEGNYFAVRGKEG